MIIEIRRVMDDPPESGRLFCGGRLVTVLAFRM